MTSEPGDGKHDTEGKASGDKASAPEDSLLAEVADDDGGKVNLFTDDDEGDLPGDGAAEPLSLADDNSDEDGETPANPAANDAASSGTEDNSGAKGASAPDTDEAGSESGADETRTASGGTAVASERGGMAGDTAQPDAGADTQDPDGKAENAAPDAEGPQEKLQDAVADAGDPEKTSDTGPEAAGKDDEAASEDPDDERRAVGAEKDATGDAPDPAEPGDADGDGAEAGADTQAPSDPVAEETPDAAGDGADASGEAPGAGDSREDAVATDEAAEDEAVTAAGDDTSDGEAETAAAAASGPASGGLAGDSFWDSAPATHGGDAHEGSGSGAETADGTGTDPSELADDAGGGSDDPDVTPDKTPEEDSDRPEPEPVVVSRFPETGTDTTRSPNPLLAAGLTGGGVTADTPREGEEKGGEEEIGEEESDEEEYYEEEEDEEDLHHSSFKRKLGVGATLLVVGALAGLWIGPKIAPGLPAGMGPVRDWLMPGQSQAEAEIEALRDELRQAISALPRPRTESQIAAIVAGSVAANRTEYEERIAALEARVEELIDIGSRADASGFEPRIAALENRIGGLAAQLSALNDNLLTFEDDGSISDEAIAQMAGFTANVEAVRAEVAGLVGQVATLEAELTELRAATERRVQDAETEIAAAQEQARSAEAAAETRAALALIDAAFESGQPFAEALARLEPYAEIPEPLAAVAEEGVATLPDLQAGFADAAYDAIRASIQAEADDSVLGRLGAFVNAQVANRSLSPQEGDGTDAILSRAEDALRRERTADAAAEIAALPEAARAAMGDWARRLKARVDAEAALAALRAGLETAREG